MSKCAWPRATLIALIVCASPALARAQDTPLAQILPELLGHTITLQPTNLPDQPNHVAHFQPGTDQLQVPTQVNEALLTMLSTYPTGTPGGGFTYVFDPALGSLTRSSESFGPSFAERAFTTGRGKVSLGFNFQHAAFDTFEGLSLRQREHGITFYIQHTDCCSRGAAQASIPDGSRLTPPFEGDLIQAGLNLELSSDTSTLFATYGLTDRVDISVAVPFVRVKLNANVLATIERLATASEPTIHEFEGANPDEHTFQLGGTATGIGDIVLRTKYAMKSTGALGLAGAVETRLPTGDENNLLGTGGVQAKLLAIASVHKGPVSPHINVGYTFSSKGALPGVTLHDEVFATVGFDYARTSRMTMSFDVLGRNLLDVGRMRMADKSYTYSASGAGTGTGGGGGGGGGGTGGGGTGQPTPAPVETKTVTFSELKFNSGNLQLYLGAAGVRFNPWRTVLVTTNLLFPLTKAGLRDRVTPAIAIDYVF